jgi:hypothetical protein
MNARAESILFSVTAVLITVMMLGALNDIAGASSAAPTVQAQVCKPDGTTASLSTSRATIATRS